MHRSVILSLCVISVIGFFYDVQAAPTLSSSRALMDPRNERSVKGETTDTTIEVSTTTAIIDTLTETNEHGVRVKRQGGCGCCGCCCCRPKCCCCRCCRCCCCKCCCCKCCRCCCCRPCCCGCGCGCCGCGGGRKRRALQMMKIQLADKMEKESASLIPSVSAEEHPEGESMDKEENVQKKEVEEKTVETTEETITKKDTNGQL